ncbi:MAG: hypothetical protein PF495_16440 [Spirochaetales bacterium]|jgi:hypothetical protein|nr:hypothetical protein [Spirochaetales bacterium]
MKKLIATVFIAITVFFTTFNCFADDDLTPPDTITFGGWATGGNASYEGEALAPGESEVFGSAGLYDDYTESYLIDNVSITSGQSAYAEIDAEGGETSGKIQGAGQQESLYNVYRQNDWDDAYTEGFSTGNQYGEAGFFGEAGSETESTTIYGEGTMTADVEGYVYNTQTADGYKSEVGSFITQVGTAEIDFTSGDVEDGYAYTEGAAVVKSGSYVGATFGKGTLAKAYSYGEAEMDYRVEAGVGSGGIFAEVSSTATTATEGYSEVWQVGNSVYAESWHHSVSSFNDPTLSEVSGSISGVTDDSDD